MCIVHALTNCTCACTDKLFILFLDVQGFLVTTLRENPTCFLWAVNGHEDPRVMSKTTLPAVWVTALECWHTIIIVHSLWSYLTTNSSLPHSPSVLTWSPSSSLYFVGTKAGSVHIANVEGDESGGLKLNIHKKRLEGYYLIFPKIVANADTCESSMYTNTCTHSRTCAHMHAHTHWTTVHIIFVRCTLCAFIRNYQLSNNN